MVGRTGPSPGLQRAHRRPRPRAPPGSRAGRGRGGHGAQQARADGGAGPAVHREIIFIGASTGGAKAMRTMRDTGCWNLAQDEATCDIFGMPREANAGSATSRV